MCKKIISLVLCIFTLANAAAISVAAESLPITETLETPLARPWSDSSLGVDASSRLAQTPEEYIFSMSDSADTKEYILLKSVNAKENDGFFVMTNGYTEKGAAYSTNSYALSKDDKKGTKTAQSVVFDADIDGSLAQKLNDNAYISEYFPLMKDYINTHTWYTEEGYNLEPYKTDCKISLLSLTEYKENYDRIGYKPNDEEMQWWLRSPHRTVDNYSLWEFLPKGIIASQYDLNSAYSKRVVRPCFYISADFFKNVKLNTQNLGGEVKKVILENVTYEQAEKMYSKVELLDIGYDVHPIGFSNTLISKSGNNIIFDAFAYNHRREPITFTLAAAVYKNGGLVKIEKNSESLSGEEKRVVTLSADMSEFENTDNMRIKVFALSDFETLTPVSLTVIDGEIKTLLNTEREGYEDVKISIPDAYQNIYNKKDAYFDVSVAYAGNSQKTYTVSYTLDDWKTQTNENITVPSIANLKKRIDIKDAPLGENTLKVKITSDGGEKAQKESKFSVMKFYEQKPLDSFYNVGTGRELDWAVIPKEHMQLIKNIGFTSIRTTPSWNVAESEKGKLAIPENSNTAKNIETYADLGLNVSFLTVAYGNKYYTDNTASSRPDMQPPKEREHIDAFANYAVNIPSLLKSKDGKTLSFKRYEIWNEPNLSTYWGYDEDSVPDPIEYTYLFNRTAARIRKDRPEAMIAAGAFARGTDGTYNYNQNFLDQMYDLGLLKYADEYSFHPYLHPRNPDTGYRSDGVKDGYVKTYVDNVTDSYLASRKNHGGWIDAAVSEVGWTTFVSGNEGSGKEGQTGTTEADQAIYLVKALVYNNYLGISFTNVFTAYDRGNDISEREHNFGIIRNDYTPKKAVFSLSQYNNACSSAQYLGKVKLADDVYGYVYQSLTKPFMIAWKIKMTSSVPDFEYVLPAKTYAEDMLGNRINGEKINIGTEPVYVYDIPSTLVKSAFSDISFDKFKNFDSYAAYSAKLDEYKKLGTMPSAEKQLEMLDNMYAFGKALIGERKSNSHNMSENEFMYGLFEIYEASKRMAAAYAMYDAEYVSSNDDLSSAENKVLAKKGNRKETSLLFTDAIMRYAKRYNKTANEAKLLSDFVGKTGFAAMNDYLAKNLCGWAAAVMETETVDISSALLPYAKSKIEVKANTAYTLDFWIDNLLDDAVNVKVYIADENGNKAGNGESITVGGNGDFNVTLSGNAVSGTGKYTYYVCVEHNGKTVIKQPFVLTVK